MTSIKGIIKAARDGWFIDFEGQGENFNKNFISVTEAEILLDKKLNLGDKIEITLKKI